MRMRRNGSSLIFDLEVSSTTFQFPYNAELSK